MLKAVVCPSDGERTELSNKGEAEVHREGPPVHRSLQVPTLNALTVRQYSDYLFH